MKQFVLRAPEHGKAMVEYVKKVAGPAAASGRPVVVTITEYKEKRSNDQNARYWALLNEIAEQVSVSGKWFSNDTWHEHFKGLFAPKTDGPAGLIAISTTQMSVEEFARYMTQIESYAARELGVEFAYA
ncbi:MAG TPA: recombination protein NinB [Paraburkholderia sp.]|nr:recombination protein NinB [Paraburkholderia sp.]